MKFERSMQLFYWLGNYVNGIVQSLPAEQAQQQIMSTLIDLDEQDFVILMDLVEMFETPPGKRLIDIDLTTVKQALETCAVRRKAISNASKN